MRVPAAILVPFLLACGAAGEDLPATLEVTSPARGALNNSESVTVTGRATDDHAFQLTVNGIAVTPAKDGAFSVEVPVTRGIAIIETHLIESSGADTRDVRSVLAGPLSPSDGSVKTEIGARAGAMALDTIGDTVGVRATAIDYTTAAKAYNPIYNNDGCLGAVVNITKISLSKVNVHMAPKTGAVTTEVVIDNLRVEMDNTKYRFSCYTGYTDIAMWASKARIRGNLGVRATDGKLVTSLTGTTVTLEGFDFDAGGVPGAVEDMFRTKVREAVEDKLQVMIRSKLPPLADRELAKLVARPYTTNVLGHATTVGVAASQVSINSEGLFVGVETTLNVAGGEGGTYVETPMPLSASVMPTSPGISVALADDTANQMLAGLWAAGAFDRQLPIESVGPLAAVLDPYAASVDIKLSLPPMVSTDGAAQLSIGDLILSVRDAGGLELQRVAITIRTTITSEASSTNSVVLTLGTPEVKAQVLAQGADLQRPLTDEGVESIVGGVWGLIGGFAGDALGKLPMPAFSGVTLGAPAVSGRDGFVLADMSVIPAT